MPLLLIIATVVTVITVAIRNFGVFDYGQNKDADSFIPVFSQFCTRWTGFVGEFYDY